jgi:hypothetical protein
MTLPIASAEALAGSPLVASWVARRAERQGPVMRQVFQRFVDHGGPVAVAEVERALSGQAPGGVRQALAALDAADLLQLRDDRIEVAYPFASRPTPFEVRLEDGRVRYACCAIDALGMGPMLARRVRVVSECHHCGEQLALSVGPEGPAARAPGKGEPAGEERKRDEEVAGVMVWIDTSCGPGRRITGL